MQKSTWSFMRPSGYALLVAFLLGSLPVQAQDEPVGEAKTSEQATPADPYIIPKGLKPQELMEYAQRVLKANQPNPAMPRQELIAIVAKQSRFFLAIGDEVLKQNPDDKKLVLSAMMLRLQGLFFLDRMKDPEATKELVKQLDAVEKDFPNTLEAKIARTMDIKRLVDAFMESEPSEEAFDTIKKNLMDLIQKEPIGMPPTLPMILVQVSKMAEERLKKNWLALKAADELLAVMKKSDNPQMLEMAKAVEASTRLDRIKGTEFKLEGMTIAGEKFDIKSFRGKIVLVDFFATWCVPCLGEIPNMIKAYEKYHDKGFEIVGVGVNDQTDKLKELATSRKIPWTVISDELTIENKMEGIGDYYGITTIPTMIIIDRQGKVVETNARGDVLEKYLEENLK